MAASQQEYSTSRENTGENQWSTKYIQETTKSGKYSTTRENTGEN